MIWTLAQVGAGGAIGAILRFLTQVGAARLFGPGFPVGTLAANTLGSFAMGLLAVWLAERGLLRAAPFLMAGVLGAYTTFSTFSLDAWSLWERGAPGLAATYVAASLVLALGGLWAGLIVGRAMA